MKQVNLQDVGLTDRYNRNRAQSNFKAIEDAVNSNATTGDQELEQLDKRITVLEDMLFGKQPQEVKVAESSTPPKNGGAMLINLTGEEDG